MTDCTCTCPSPHTLTGTPLVHSTYACYRTTTQQNGFLQTCEADIVREREISTINSNKNYTIMYVHTPGRLLDRTYVNRYLYNAYRIVYTCTISVHEHYF